MKVKAAVELRLLRMKGYSQLEGALNIRVAIGHHWPYRSKAGSQVERAAVSGAGRQQENWERALDFSPRTCPSGIFPSSLDGTSALHPSLIV